MNDSQVICSYKFTSSGAAVNTASAFMGVCLDHSLPRQMSSRLSQRRKEHLDQNNFNKTVEFLLANSPAVSTWDRETQTTKKHLIPL